MHSEQIGFWQVLQRVSAGRSVWVKHIACLAITLPPTSMKKGKPEATPGMINGK
jgi:hypothetical protein